MDANPRRRVQAGRCLVAAALACLLLGGFMSAPGRADTSSKLKKAKAELASLVASIDEGEAKVASLQQQLQATAATVAAAHDRAAALDVAVIQTRQAIDRTAGGVAAIRARLDARARAQFMNGPLTGLDVVLGASSLADIADSLEFMNRLSEQDSALARQAQQTAQRLGATQSQLERLLSQQLHLLQRLANDQAALTTQFAAQQVELSKLAGERARANDLIKQLRKELAAQALSAARSAAGSGMTITYGDWAVHLLSALGVSGCQNNLVLVVAWEVSEYTQASWNPLATTYWMPGSTTFNSAGVKNYASLDQGLAATVGTLRKGGHGYEAILSDLAACSDPTTTGRAVNASDWCRGCAGGTYVTAIIPSVEAYYSSYANR
jgi:peptidoglycan hydrolase CwlO-like protein